MIFTGQLIVLCMVWIVNSTVYQVLSYLPNNLKSTFHRQCFSADRERHCPLGADESQTSLSHSWTHFDVINLLGKTHVEWNSGNKV